MNKKVIFIDVDGTLCNDLGLVPQSATIAIQAARKKGHLIYLCTGRCKAELYDSIMEIGFDGILGSGGGFVESKGEMLYHKKFETNDLHDILAFFEEHNINYYVECNHGMFASHGCIPHLRRISKMISDLGEDANGADQFTNALLELHDDTILEEVNKICFLDNGFPFHKVKDQFSNRFTIMHCTVPMFGDNSGEVILKGIDKAFAMAYLMDHLHLDQKDTIALGDGMNDEVMLAYAQVGVAMGNAAAGLKAMADDITASHDENGIYQTFEKYGII